MRILKDVRENSGQIAHAPSNMNQGSNHPQPISPRAVPERHPKALPNLEKEYVQDWLASYEQQSDFGH